MSKKRKPSSKRWLREHETDPYVQRARRDGYRSRSVYKLEELDQRDHLIRPGITVVDLGAAPGGWSQVAAARTLAAERLRTAFANVAVTADHCDLARNHHVEGAV